MEKKLQDLELAVLSFKATSDHFVDGELGSYFAENIEILIDWVFDTSNMKRSFMSSMILTSKNTEIAKGLCHPGIVSNLRERWEQNKENKCFIGKFWELATSVIPYLENFEDCDFVLYFISHTDDYTSQFFFEKAFSNDPKAARFYKWIATSEFGNIAYSQLKMLTNINEDSNYADTSIYRAVTLFKILTCSSKIPVLADILISYRFMNIYKRGFNNKIITNYLWELIYELSLTIGNEMIDLIPNAIENLLPTEKPSQSQYYSVLFISKLMTFSNSVTESILQGDVVRKILNLYISHPENTFVCQALHTFINSANRKPKIMECVLQTIIPYMVNVISNGVNSIQVGIAYDIFQLLLQLQRTSIPVRAALRNDNSLIDIVQNKISKRNNDINQKYGGNIEKDDTLKIAIKSKIDEIGYPKEILF